MSKEAIKNYIIELKKYRNDQKKDVAIHQFKTDVNPELLLKLTDTTLCVTYVKDKIKSETLLDFETSNIFVNKQKMPTDYFPEFLNKLNSIHNNIDNPKITSFYLKK